MLRRSPDDPRRLAQVAWLIEHNPRHVNCRTPYCSVDPEAAPDAFVSLKKRWLEWLNREPDSEIARGAAAFVAGESVDEAKRILRPLSRERLTNRLSGSILVERAKILRNVSLRWSVPLRLARPRRIFSFG